MIQGAHVILYSKQADSLRQSLAELFPAVDAGHGWLIFALPPTELAVHPSETSSHELYLMCTDLNAP